MEKSLFTIPQFVDKHTFLTQGALRYQIFCREKNKLADSGAIVRIGKRVFIDEQKYFFWVDSLQEGKCSSTTKEAC